MGSPQPCFRLAFPSHCGVSGPGHGWVGLSLTHLPSCLLHRTLFQHSPGLSVPSHAVGCWSPAPLILTPGAEGIVALGHLQPPLCCREPTSSLRHRGAGPALPPCPGSRSPLSPGRTCLAAAPSYFFFLK